ncbi:hypothetical protein ABPG75_005778 [Micractinium tetrahymenae]
MTLSINHCVFHAPSSSGPGTLPALPLLCPRVHQFPVAGSSFRAVRRFRSTARAAGMSQRVAAAALVVLLLCAAVVSARRLTEGATVQLGPCTPHQLHISLTGNPSELRVSWKTRSGSCPSTVTLGPAEALLQHPPEPALLRSHHGSQHSYSSADMCAPPARHYGFGPTFLHTAVLTGLEPRQRYFYQVEGGQPVEFTAPVPAGPRHSFRFLVFGDMGESEHRAAKSPGAGRTVEMLAREQQDGAELVLHIGDISYANGDEEIWDTFMDSIEPIARHIPYMVGTGNHEYDYQRSGYKGEEAAQEDPSGETSGFHPSWGNFGNDSGGECGVQLSKRFQMPDVSDAGYCHGSVHFVVVSTEHDLSSGSRQHRWLERDLRHVDRCMTPWVVLGMHRPMYVVYPHKSNRVVGDHLRAQLEGLLNDYQVDLVVSGHVHSYSRTCNVLDEECVPADEGGMTHIIAGCAGHKLTDVSHDQEPWLEYAAVRFGYGRVTVSSGRSLLFEMVGEDGRVYDSVKLHNSRASLRGCGGAEPEMDEHGEDSCARGTCPPWMQAQQQAQQQAIVRSSIGGSTSVADA